ncbi:MAG: hypothetical protein K6G71_03190, partial [Clostridiales bacterium]|nr:hypothetical protein [Clostridiales bacterium]
LLSEVGLVDTMSDLIFCTVGSLIGMFITAFWHAGIIGPDRKNRRPKEIERMKRDKQEELDFLAAEQQKNEVAPEGADEGMKTLR